jgi:hypothetical protein
MIQETTPPALGTDLSPNDRAVLAAYWRGRGNGEMGAEIAFRQVREDMETLGAPAALLAIAERAIKDECKHGHWGRDFALRFGGTDTSEPVASRTRLLEFPRASSRDNRVLRIAFCCFNETVGCHVLQEVRPRMVLPELRDNNQQHLADEVQHARVGWGFLSTLGLGDRSLIHRYRKILLRMVQMACCEGGERPELDHLVPYGYFTPEVLRAGYERAIAEVIDPGLAHLAITEAA